MTDVVLCECFARDGLQHEPDVVPTPTKRALIAAASSSPSRRDSKIADVAVSRCSLTRTINRSPFFSSLICMWVPNGRTD